MRSRLLRAAITWYMVTRHRRKFNEIDLDEWRIPSSDWSDASCKRRASNESLWRCIGLSKSVSNVEKYYPFIQYKYIVSKTIVKLWNYKSNDLPKNGLPSRAWRRQPSHQLDKVSEGRRPEHLLNNTGTVVKLQLRLSIYMGLFLRNA